MSSSTQRSPLTRLLALNSRTYDLENLLFGLALPGRETWGDSPPDVDVPHPIAELQDEIDQLVRTSLVTCWLGIPDEADP